MNRAYTFKRRHICGAISLNGRPCSIRVDSEAGRCHYHRNGLTPTEKIAAYADYFRRRAEWERAEPKSSSDLVFPSVLKWAEGRISDSDLRAKVADYHASKRAWAVWFKEEPQPPDFIAVGYEVDAARRLVSAEKAQATSV